MLTAISAVIGFLGSIVPTILKFYQQREDRKHELAVMDKQLEAQKVLGAQRLEETNINADVSESMALYKAAEPTITGVKWVDATLEVLNSLMRPTVVYCYFGAYLVTKYAIYTIIVATTGLAWNQAVLELWTEFDKAMFGGIMGFLFGNRSIDKWFNRKKYCGT
jgi:ABC-type cobalamin transport system permease subunit